MFGAIIGDIVGSRYEGSGMRSKRFAMFAPECHFTDDTVMTVAVARALLECDWHEEEVYKEILVRQMRWLGRAYPNAGYGEQFKQWLFSENPQPYGSFGNGAAMRVSPCGLLAHSLDEALTLAKLTAEVTHNHPEGIRGAQAVAAAVYLARTGVKREVIRCYCRCFYPLEQTLSEIRSGYVCDQTCQGSVPQALTAALESANYEDAIRSAVSLGGDSDTLAAIAGSVAWSYYRFGKSALPREMARARQRAENYLPASFLETIGTFEDLCAEHGSMPCRVR